MMCKYCGSEKTIKNGKVNGVQVFKCKACGHRFTEGSEFPKMRTESKIIAISIDLYFEGLSVRKIQNQIEKIFEVDVSQVTIWKWVIKYAKLVSGYVEKLTPQLSGIYSVGETAIKCSGIQKWFWEIIDEQTKFMVASHLSGSRTAEDAIALFEQSMKIAKKLPKMVSVDGLPAYVQGYNKVFRTMKKSTRPELVRRVGIRGVKNNNAVERLHGTLKDRIKPARGLKDEEPVRTLLQGWNVHYNYVRKHQSLKGKTPAQAAGLKMKNEWHALIKEAVRSKIEAETKVSKMLEQTMRGGDVSVSAPDEQTEMMAVTVR
jgi:transposase-like protein